MAFRKNNALVIASLLAVAAVVCLGVGLRLLAVSGEIVTPAATVTDTHLVALLTIGGGVVVFLLGTVALLIARRSVLAAGRRPESLPQDLNLVAIQDWSRELAEIRDDMRRDLADIVPQPELQHHLLEVPASWHPEAQYLISDDGKPADPLADLKRTRDHLMDAARRVDIIVQSINDTTSTIDIPTGSHGKKQGRRRWWELPWKP